MKNTDDIEDLDPSKFQAKYAIPGDPPTAVAKAEIPEGTTMRTGPTAKNEFGPGGGNQYTLPKSKVPESEFSEDWFHKSAELSRELTNN